MSIVKYRETRKRAATNNIYTFVNHASICMTCPLGHTQLLNQGSTYEELDRSLNVEAKPQNFLTDPKRTSCFMVLPSVVQQNFFFFFAETKKKRLCPGCLLRIDERIAQQASFVVPHNRRS